LNELASKTSGQVAMLTTFDVFGVFTGFVIGKFDEANDIIEGMMIHLPGPENLRPESINDFFWQEDIGEWGSTCLCPNGDLYYSGCLDHSCSNLACFMGKPGRVQRTAGPWSHRVTACSSTDTTQTYPAKIFVAMKNQSTQEWIYRYTDGLELIFPAPQEEPFVQEGCLVCAEGNWRASLQNICTDNPEDSTNKIPNCTYHY
jgi:Ca2+-binding EF-hand superfamily protein